MAGAAEAGAGAAKAGANAEAATATSAGVNVQSFPGQLGGPPPAVISSAACDRPFSVNGATFLNEGAAIHRSCDLQKNACSYASISGQIQGGTAQCAAPANA